MSKDKYINFILEYVYQKSVNTPSTPENLRELWKHGKIMKSRIQHYFLFFFDDEVILRNTKADFFGRVCQNTSARLCNE